MTFDDLLIAGPPIRMADVIALTGLSWATLRAEMERGELTGFQIVARRGSPWLFERADVLRWWTHKRLDLAS